VRPICASLIAGLLMTLTPLVHGQSPAADSSTATPESAALFIGAWVIEAQGEMGPATFHVTVAAADGGVTADISSDFMYQHVTDVRKQGEALVLRYSFDYDGTPVPAVMTLVRVEERMGAVIDFGAGAYVMQGAGTRAPAEASAEVPGPQDGQPAAVPE